MISHLLYIIYIKFQYQTFASTFFDQNIHIQVLCFIFCLFIIYNQEEEKRLRDEHIAYLEQEALHDMRKEQFLKMKTEHSKSAVAVQLKEKRKELQIKKVSNSCNLTFHFSTFSEVAIKII